MRARRKTRRRARDRERQNERIAQLVFSPIPTPLETRASHVRAVFASLCESSVGARDDSRRRVSVSNRRFSPPPERCVDAAPARHAEVLGPAGDDGVADRFADAVAGVSAVVVRRFAAKLARDTPRRPARKAARLRTL